jgi:hypothetical protein
MPDWWQKINKHKTREKRNVMAMDQHGTVSAAPSYRIAGRAAIASGIIGIAAFGLLMDAVLTRVTWVPANRIYLLFNTHDVGVSLQFLLLILVAFGLRTLSQQRPPGFSKALFRTGVGAMSFVVLLVLLGMGQKLISNGYYMFPQGIFGIWLILVNWRLSGSLPVWLRWAGMIVGWGLVLVGVSFVGIGFVYPSMMAIPPAPIETVKEVNSPANTFFHQLLFYASFVGVVLLPVWTILTGLRLLKERRLAAITADLASDPGLPATASG